MSGAAVILFQMAQNGVVNFASSAAAGASASASAPTPTPPPAPTMTANQLAAQFDNAVTFSDNQASDSARSLQLALNTFPDIHLGVDGVPGQQTSDVCLTTIQNAPGAVHTQQFADIRT
jgi:hypothetical protein